MVKFNKELDLENHVFKALEGEFKGEGFDSLVFHNNKSDELVINFNAR
jgi:hypothetical protein